MLAVARCGDARTFTGMIEVATFDFLRQLAQHNDRDWFNAHKGQYEAARKNVAEFADALLERLRKHDVLSTENGKKSLFRIYRDVRFSKSKLPYKTHFSGQFVRDGRQRRGGYYFQLGPQENIVGGGFFGIERDDLIRIRQELGRVSGGGGPRCKPGEMRSVLSDKRFVKLYGELQGEQLKTAPQGFSRDHPNIDLLRYKQFYAMRNFTEEEVLADDFIDRAEEAVLGLRPFFDYFSEVLTTDANGESIL